MPTSGGPTWRELSSRTSLLPCTCHRLSMSMSAPLFPRQEPLMASNRPDLLSFPLPASLTLRSASSETLRASQVLSCESLYSFLLSVECVCCVLSQYRVNYWGNPGGAPASQCNGCTAWHRLSLVLMCRPPPAPPRLAQQCFF